MNHEDAGEPVPDAREAGRGSALGLWWRQGARSALLLKPDWRGLRATPAHIAALIVVPFAAGLLAQRLYIAGPATFYWPALHAGWLSTLVAAWACWVLVPEAQPDAEPGRAPSAAALFGMMSAQALSMILALSLLFIPLVRSGLWPTAPTGGWLEWLGWLIPAAWVLAAQVRLAWHSSPASPLRRASVAAMLVGVFAFGEWQQPMRPWYPEMAGSETARPTLTQELFEAQAQALQRGLDTMAADRRGVIDVYVLTFAPYAHEEVFMRESDMVAEVMQSRFDASGRTLQLVNNAQSAGRWPWATTLNLRRAIERVAQRMDRDEDILFLHLTSHGARSGALSADFWPLSTESVTPQMLKAWLDAAGIRHRIVSVSACYSGTWIAPLADAGTLVMSAADAEHTSYGCGRGSELTYFGRAMYDEQLRRTWSFEAAHARARLDIERRENEAGKSDGYSNPQIHVGAAIREHLARLQLQRESAVH